MPTYSYRCAGCGHEFDRFLSISKMNDPVKEPCPSCNAYLGVRLVVGSPRIVSGVGDYRNKAPDVFKDRLKDIKKRHPKGNIET